MARPLKIEFPGAIYHVTARGSAREAIVRDDADRDLFLDTLGEVVTRFGWLCHAHCLMNNHYNQFSKTRSVAQRRYAEFVAQGRNLPSLWPELKGQVLLGSEAFVAKMRPLLEGKGAPKKISRAQRWAHRPGLKSLFSAHVRQDRRRNAEYYRATPLIF
jgi:hypothetical protein